MSTDTDNEWSYEASIFQEVEEQKLYIFIARKFMLALPFFSICFVKVLILCVTSVCCCFSPGYGFVCGVYCSGAAAESKGVHTATCRSSGL